MNRPIKFRIWDNLTNEMYCDALVGNCRGESTVPCVYLNDVGWAHTDNCVVEQFTGLLDKNGKEIYEGDVVVGYGTWNLIVSIENGHTVIKWTDYDSSKQCIYLEQEWINGEEAVVIGNIHDNKELL